jgi:Clostripain family
MILITHLSLLHAATWRVFVYMDSSDGLSDMAIKNIADQMQSRMNDDVEFLVQLHAYEHTALRFRVAEKSLSLIEEVAITGASRQDFVDAATWAFSGHNYTHTMLIFWNHGWGIIDPHWSESLQQWISDNGTLGISCGTTPLFEAHQDHKGFMFNAHYRTYLNNFDLIEALEDVKNKVIQKKIDILAFDTCMGAMFEIAYQFEPYADYLVGNPTCSLRDGFNYKTLGSLLTRTATPKEVAIGMVSSFDQYYSIHDKDGIYAHSAFDLSKIYLMREKFDAVITDILDLPNTNALVQASQQSPRFCLFPFYIDLISFFKNIEKKSPSLQVSVDNFCQTAQDFIIAHCSAPTLKDKLHGLAVYLPIGAIDEGYQYTRFAQQSLWIQLLHSVSSSLITA